MAGKAPVTAEQLTAMIKQTATDSFTVGSGGPGTPAQPQGGGQGIDMGYNASPAPAIGAPARPMQEVEEGPAIPGQTAVAPTSAPTTGVQEPGTVFPGQPEPTVQSLNEELAAARRRLDEIETQNKLAARARVEAEYEARIASLPEAERAQATIDHEKMLRLDAQIQLARAELRQTHPLFVMVMDTIAEEANVEVEPDEYRALAAKMEPVIEKIVAERSTAYKQQLGQQVAQQWGVRPAPEQGLPPSPEHPAMQQYNKAREEFRRTATPEAAKQLVVANTRLKNELGIDGGAVVR